jgi:hypothetical protein
MASPNLKCYIFLIGFALPGIPLITAESRLKLSPLNYLITEPFRMP